MSEQIKGFWLKNLLKGKVWILGVLVLILNVACGGGGGDAATPTPVGAGTPATPPSTPSTPATPPPVAGIKVPKELDVVRVK